MLVLLPPSETKREGGDGPPLDLDALSHAELSPVRELLVGALGELAADAEASLEALGLGAGQLHEIERNARLRDAPTMPALERYSGVLYDALDAPSLRVADRRRAGERIAIGSALFGLVRADDPIPQYRLSGGSRLPGVGTLGAVWKHSLAPLLDDVARRELVVDLRSGAYRSIAPVRDAVRVNVLLERPDGTRSVVSHHNKSTKGLLARLLVRTTGEPRTVRDVARVARRGGLTVEVVDARRLDVVGLTNSGAATSTR